MDETAGSFVQAWRQARPLRGLALRFLPAHELAVPCWLALQDQLLQSLYGIGAPQVALAKLAWWAEELARLAGGGARHPLAIALSADARIARVPAALWPQAGTALLAAAEAPASRDFTAQCEEAESVFAALAGIECALVFGARADATRTRAVLARQALLCALLQTPQRGAGGPLPLPLGALARHALSRERLADAGAGARVALAEHGGLLAQSLRQSLRQPGPLLALRAAEAAHDIRALRRAARAERPLAVLYARRQALGPVDAWRCWRLQRAVSRAGAGGP